jgi:hypothetical protein
MWKMVASLAGVLVLGCSSSSGGGSGGGGGGGSGGSCTGGPTSPNACLGPGRDSCNPCTKVTDAQASAAVGGVPLTPGAQDADLCQWFQGSANNPTLVVSFTVGIDPGTFNDDCNPPAGSGFQSISVSGVGDAACYFKEAANYGWSLMFLKGCAEYETDVNLPLGTQTIPDAQQQAEEKALALDAVPNL